MEIFQYINPTTVFDRLPQHHIGNIDITDAIHTVPFSGKEQGSLLVFPSFVHHQVQKITRGERRSLVGWACGEKLYLMKVSVSKVDDVFMKVHCDDGLARDLYDFFLLQFQMQSSCLRSRIDFGMVRSDYSQSKQTKFISVYFLCR